MPQCILYILYNGFVVTDALGHMMTSYTLLVPMNAQQESSTSEVRNASFHKAIVVITGKAHGIHIIYNMNIIYYAHRASM